MAERIYAMIGSFAMKPGTQKGIHIFRYNPENAVFTRMGDYRPEINAGQSTYNREKDIFYITHESKAPDGQLGGGGRILSCKLNHETGEPLWVDEVDTCAALPSYLCLEQTGNYVLVPHHGTENVITKTRKSKDGGYEAFTDSDDAALAVFSIAQDGSFGNICDICCHESQRTDGVIRKISHLHCCVQSPDGKLYLVCDKGLDSIHGYHLDTEYGTLFQVSETFVEEAAHPRYGVFHPVMPVFYQNCENSVFVHVWKYNSGTGELTHLQKLALLEDEEKALEWTAESSADIVITPDGRFVYISVRGLNVLSVLAVEPEGTLHFLQSIDCQGINPRGLCLSPDSRYLFSINRDSNNIARFKILEDGTLEAMGDGTKCPLPANMKFVVYHDIS